MDGSYSSAFLTLLTVISLFLYFAPAIIGACREHKDIKALFVLNLFAGWSLVGWVIALVWAFKNQEK